MRKHVAYCKKYHCVIGCDSLLPVFNAPRKMNIINSTGHARRRGKLTVVSDSQRHFWFEVPLGDETCLIGCDR